MDESEANNLRPTLKSKMEAVTALSGRVSLEECEAKQQSQTTLNSTHCTRLFNKPIIRRENNTWQHRNRSINTVHLLQNFFAPF